MQSRIGKAARLGQSARSSAGFTLLEVIVVVVIVGILAAIAAPGWQAFLAERQLNAAQEQVHQAMQMAQSQAKVNHVTWQASFQEFGGRVQWATHSAKTQPANALWNALDPSIQLDSAETTLPSTTGIRRVQFDRRGALAGGSLGRITLISKNNGKTKRCVIVSTLLGVTRKGQNQPKPVAGKYCR